MCLICVFFMYIFFNSMNYWSVQPLFEFYSLCSQMATPSLKMRTEWCLSPRSSERTTPPSRGPTRGEASAFLFTAGLLGAAAAVSSGDIWSLTGRSGGVCVCLRRWGEGGFGKRQKKGTLCRLWGKRDLKEKNKEQNKSRSLSAVVVCRADMIRALCFLSSLWFFTVCLLSVDLSQKPKNPFSKSKSNTGQRLVSDAFALVKDCQRAVVYTIVQVLVNLRKNVKANVMKLLCVSSATQTTSEQMFGHVFVFALEEASVVWSLTFYYAFSFRRFLFKCILYTCRYCASFLPLHLFMFFLKKLPPATCRSPVSTVFAADVLLST